MKKFLCLVLSMAILVGCFGASASAAEATYPMVLHTYITTEDFASDEWITAQKGAYLLNGTSTIAKPDSTHINISGFTNATQTCDKVRLTLSVERSKSYATGYSTYKTYVYSADNAYQLAKAVSNISVEKGYYYRVYGVHSVQEGSTIETTNSVTDPISFL